MFEFQLSAIVIIASFVFLCVGLAFLCIKHIYDKKRNLENGKIKINFTEINDGDEDNSIKHANLILEIRYRLIEGTRHNKEEVAVLINDLVQKKCKLRGFRIRNNSKKTLKEIKDIMEKIKPLLPRDTNSELIAANYRMSEKTIPNWPKDIFVKS